ncbi:MAG: HDOD domain-containing protein [Phycisphaerae bacterium]
MEVFVARQPVFNGQKEVYGYQLSFRSRFESYYRALEANKSDADLMAFVNFGELTVGKKGFVNFSRDLLLMEFPILFPNDATVAMIPGGINSDEDALARCRELKQYGYTLAINDFGSQLLDSPFLDVADIAVVDFAKTPADERQVICEGLSDRRIAVLAGNVETAEDFDQAASWGYSYFQGEFFARPIVRPDQEIAANKLTYLQLLREVNSAALSYDDIASLVEQDVALTYKLLRFMNSAWFGLKFEVNSVRHALVLLGPKEIKRWVSLVAVRSTGDDKPEELLVRSLTRAKASEQIGILADMESQASELFLMGMFSVMDALADKPMGEVLEKLPLTEDIKNALLGTTGTFRDVYEAVLCYERGDWEDLSAAVAALKLDEEKVPELFRESLKWATDALKEI